MAEVKTCTRCQEEKPRSDFYKDSAKKDGLASYCKPCDLEANRERRDRLRGRGRVNVEWSEDLFLEKLAERFPHLKLASPYVKAQETVTLECLRCGNIIKMRPRDVAGNRFSGHCKECLRLKKGREFVAELLKAGYFPQFRPEDYQRNGQALEVLCGNGTLFTTNRRDFMATTRPRRGCVCSACKEKPRTHKFRSELEARADLEEHGFILAGPYRNTGTHVVGFWVECGHYDYLKPVCIFIRKAGCQTCYDQRRSEAVKLGKQVA